MKVYRGLAHAPTEPAVVEVWERPRGRPDQRLGPLEHFPKHSPAGFSWGYGGSGPSELARCLLIDHYGEGAKCVRCANSGLVVYLEAAGDGPIDDFPTRPATTDDEPEATSSCPDCYGEKCMIPPGLYQAFKFEHVAHWPQDGEWVITADEIAGWLAAREARHS